MKINKLNREFGKDSINQIENTNRYDINGALACLQTFYYSFNNKDLDVFRKVWYDNDLVQLNNFFLGNVSLCEYFFIHRKDRVDVAPGRLIRNQTG
ncbi:MAG: hypothetical protein ACTHML_10035 [Ginsengibacter sp.]